MGEKICCSHCGALIENENFRCIGEKILCADCVANYTTTCAHCSAIIWGSDDYGDENISLCESCYNERYIRCYDCDALVNNEESYEYDGDYYCHRCYREIIESKSIREYSYKPDPIFYGKGERFFGVELEIDDGGREDYNAQAILQVANKDDDYIYIKSDGSLDDGMEIVSHPMSLNFHKNYCWEDILNKAISLGYRSHQTSTCGYHIHVNRNCLGETMEEQDEVISKILYFIECHWNEILKFSRRTEYSMNRWAARYGYESSPKAILDKAKKVSGNRYTALNLSNYHTIEFRLFRGTLRYSTFISTLELVNCICDVAINCDEKEIKKLSWLEFVAGIKDAPELVQYLKEKKLYVNTDIKEEEDI